MTQLKKPIKRESQSLYRGKPIIFQIEPPGIIRVKEKGRRLWYETTIESVFTLAAKQHAERTRKERKAKK